MGRKGTENKPEKATEPVFSDNLTFLKSTVITLTNTISEMSSKIDNLMKTIEEKDALIAQLYARLNKNSSNSSKPSSSDFFNKPKPSIVNKRRSGKPKSTGGQKGHSGSTMKLKEKSDVIENLMPAKCSACPNHDSCASGACVCSSRHKLDIKLSVIQTEYNQLSVACPLAGGEVLKGEYPESVKAPLVYGEELKSLVAVLSSFGMMSQGRISELLQNAFGISISDGTVSNIIVSVAEDCSAVRAGIDEKVLLEPVIHADETGLREMGKVNWMHTASTERLTSLHATAKRGKDGMDEIGILAKYKGTCVHDCLAAYFSEDFSFEHALCNAHLDRELQGVLDNTEQKWPKKMQKLLDDMYAYKKKLSAKGIAAADPAVLESFFSRWDRILDIGYNQNPAPKSKETGKRGRKKRGKILCLLDRMKKHKNSFMKFITDFKVPFSNNTAEKSYRLSKQKIKVAGTFRSVGGADNFAAIFSVIDTFRKNGFPPLAVIRDIITGKDVLAYL